MTVSDLQRAQNSHKYRDPRSGALLTSVTSIVGNWDDGDKLGAGAGAAVKLTKLGINYRDEWNAKRDLGNRLHAYAALWAEGKSAEVLDADQGHLDGFTAFCNAKHPEWLWSERAVVSSLGFGGRLDLIGYWEGQYHLVDLKSGRIWRRELSLQLAGYGSADGFVVYDDEGMAAEVEPMPHIDAWHGLYLSGDGRAELVDVPAVKEGQSLREAQAEAVAAFNHLLSVRKWAEGQPK